MHRYVHVSRTSYCRNEITILRLDAVSTSCFRFDELSQRLLFHFNGRRRFAGYIVKDSETIISRQSSCELGGLLKKISKN